MWWSRFRSTYQHLLPKLPLPLRRFLVQAIFVATNKPFCAPRPLDPVLSLGEWTVRLTPFPARYRGALVLSADFEMAWAWRYAKAVHPGAESLGLRERANVPRLVALCEQYRVPVTWATVGHLFLRACRRTEGQAHADMPRIGYFENRVWKYTQGDWYDHDPCTSWREAPAWYAPDLVQLIQGAAAGHELGCHTFSHLDFTDERCPETVAEAEIRACQEAMAEFGLIPRSMVFPGGTAGHFDLLARHGFTNIRKRLRDEIELAYPLRLSEGLWMLPSSNSIDGQEGGQGYIIKRLCKYIDRAIDQGLVCHFWFHPSMDEVSLCEVFPEVLRYAAEKRGQELLWIAPMRDLANYCELRHQSQMQVLSSLEGCFRLRVRVDTERFEYQSLWITTEGIDSAALLVDPASGQPYESVRRPGAIAWKLPTDGRPVTVRLEQDRHGHCG